MIPARHTLAEAGLRDETGRHPVPQTQHPDLSPEGFAMTTTHQDLWIFIHRMGPDGSFESICPVCFESVGWHGREEDLAQAEQDHACDLDGLGKLAYFYYPAQD